MSLTVEVLRDEVCGAIGASVVRQIQRFVAKKLLPVNLWGDVKRKDGFTSYMVLLTIYKDLKNESYNVLFSRQLRRYRLSRDSLQHNIKKIRVVLASWGEEMTTLENWRRWQRYQKSIKIKTAPNVSDQRRWPVSLWMDSTDVRMAGKNSMSRTDENWSYKANGPGRRFMMVSDGRGIIRKTWGPYSPKTHDSTWLKFHEAELNTLLKNGVIVADAHFSWAREDQHISEVKFLVPYSAAGHKRKRDNSDLSERQKSYNQAVREVRSRVESPFGLMKQRFKALDDVFYEDETQLGYLFQFACGVENKKRRMN